MRVHPIKPTLKAPGTKRLKLTYDKLLSSFAINFKLRRYTVGEQMGPAGAALTTRTRPTLSSDEPSPRVCRSTHPEGENR